MAKNAKQHPVEIKLAVRALHIAAARLEAFTLYLPNVVKAGANDPDAFAEFLEVINEGAVTAARVVLNVHETLEIHDMYFPYTDEERAGNAPEKAYARLQDGPLCVRGVSGENVAKNTKSENREPRIDELMRNIIKRMYDVSYYLQPDKTLGKDGRRTKVQAKEAMNGIYDVLDDLQKELGIGDVVVFDPNAK